MVSRCIPVIGDQGRSQDDPLRVMQLSFRSHGLAKITAEVAGRGQGTSKISFPKGMSVRRNCSHPGSAAEAQYTDWGSHAPILWALCDKLLHLAESQFPSLPASGCWDDRGVKWHHKEQLITVGIATTSR